MNVRRIIALRPSLSDVCSWGADTMIGANVTIADTDAHVLWPPESRRHNPGFEEDRPVTIGRNVWLGVGCTILKGVTVGDNSVIGAMSVVTSDISANVVAAGVPARVLKTLPGTEESS